MPSPRSPCPPPAVLSRDASHDRARGRTSSKYLAPSSSAPSSLQRARVQVECIPPGTQRCTAPSATFPRFDSQTSLWPPVATPGRPSLQSNPLPASLSVIDATPHCRLHTHGREPRQAATAHGTVRTYSFEPSSLARTSRTLSCRHTLRSVGHSMPITRNPRSPEPTASTTQCPHFCSRFLVSSDPVVEIRAHCSHPRRKPPILGLPTPTSRAATRPARGHRV